MVLYFFVERVALHTLLGDLAPSSTKCVGEKSQFLCGAARLVHVGAE